jgi:signal transduction histidine kinase
MSEDVRARAIDPFFTTKPPGQGTGLGLSMTFGYIRQSNGHLTIESEPGKGTTITILMPRSEAAAGGASEGIQRHG